MAMVKVRMLMAIRLAWAVEEVHKDGPTTELFYGHLWFHGEAHVSSGQGLGVLQGQGGATFCNLGLLHEALGFVHVSMPFAHYCKGGRGLCRTCCQCQQA